MEQIKLDIVPVGVAPVAHASQFDNGRQIRFNLFNQGTPYTLTGAETVTMVVNGEEENVTNTSDNYVIWDVAEEDCEEVGVIGCEIRIVLGSMLIGSKNFFLEVEMDPYDGLNIRTITVGPAGICTFETELAEPLASVKTALAPSLTGYTAVNLTACGVNLFDKTNVADGYIDDTTGAVSGGAYYKHTDYLPVVSGQKIYILTEQTSAKWGAWYDKDKNYLSGITNYTQTEVTVPNNACYIRLTCKTDDTGNLDTFAVNYPSTSTYHAYTGNAYVIALGDTYYGGTLDVTTGVLTVEYDSSLQPITPYDVQLSPTAVRAIVGVNNVFSDTGETELKYLTIEA